MLKIRAILNNCAPDNRMVMGFYFNIGLRAENTPGCHPATNYHRFLDFRLEFTSAKPNIKISFPYNVKFV